METASTPPRLTRGTQNLRIWMAANAPELNLAAAHSGGGVRGCRWMV